MFASFGSELFGQMVPAGAIVGTSERAIAMSLTNTVFGVHNFVTDLIIRKYVRW